VSRRIVLGIGNPGPEYEGTRHNVGFLVLDRLARDLELTFEHPHAPVLVARGETEAGPFQLIKPLAYVNRSGEALLEYLAGESVDPDRVLIVVDDLALDPGVVRLRAKGSAGGHNGLRSLIAALGTESFPRMKVGIGGVPASEWREHVLSTFGGDEAPVMAEAMERAASGVLGFLNARDFQQLQQSVNRVSPSTGVNDRGTPRSDSAARAVADAAAVRRGREFSRGGTSVSEDNNKSTNNKYEGMFLVNNSKLAEEAGAGVGVVTEFLEKHSCNSVRTDVWDERKLAYPIARQKRGTYVLSHFEAGGESIDSMNREITIREDIMRALFVRHEEFPEFKIASEMEPVRRRDDDEREGRGDRRGGGGGFGGGGGGFGGGRGDGPRSRPAPAPAADAPAADAPAPEAPTDVAPKAEAPAEPAPDAPAADTGTPVEPKDDSAS